MKKVETKMSLKKDILLAVIAFLIAILTLGIILVVFGFAPFGSRSLATGDIDVAQFDEYGYLKDVLTGENSFGYTFSMGLGGDTANVVSYSMSSPFNLLILAFPKEDFHIFFNLLAVLKIGLIAATWTFYFRRRFDGKVNNVFSLSLGLCGAFSQYSIAQICNIFWLDGVIMMPLLLLGVYRIIQQKSPVLMTVSVALAIIFNWYSGATVCLFSIFWFILEISLYNIRNERMELKTVALTFLKYAVFGIVGGMLSAFLLLPTVKAIKNGNRGSFNWELLVARFNGNPLTAISNDTIGSSSGYSIVSLYCGELPVIGCFAYFLNKSIKISERIVCAAFVVFVVLTFYFQPLYLLFSLMKNATSFWSRYSYIGIFTLTFVAASFFEGWAEDQNKVKEVVLAGVSFSILVILLNALRGRANWKLIILTVIITLVISIILSWVANGNNLKKSLRGFVLVCLTLIELAGNVFILLPSISIANADIYHDYVENQKDFIGQVKLNDDSEYRISDLQPRNTKKGEIIAMYNEAFMYNYMSIATYTNSPDDTQRNVLNKLGYRTNGENYYIVNDTVLPADSLLGVKYILSPQEVPGLNKLDILEKNGKFVYENPFALPLSFFAEKSDKLTDYNDNPFKYTNDLYTALLGKKTELYKKADFVTKNVTSESVTYQINIPSGQYVLYGNILWGETPGGKIVDSDGHLITRYAMWGSPSVFYIPVKNGEDYAEITFSSDSALDVRDEQFYLLDLNSLKLATDEIKDNGKPKIEINGSNVEITAELEKPKTLYTSLPYDDGWKITDNGVEIKPDKLENCLMNFDLNTGKHDIKLKYELPGLKDGLLISLMGLLILVANVIYERNRMNP